MDRTFYQKRDLAEAERLYQASLRMRERYFTRNSDRVGQTLHNLASLARAQGREARAEELYRECLQIREHVWGGPHPETIKTAEQLLRLYRASDRKEDMRALQVRRPFARAPSHAPPYLAMHPLAMRRPFACHTPHLTMRALQRSIGAWRREGSIDASATWLRAWVAFPLREVAGEFKLNSRILGPKGMHLKHLIRESGAEKVELGLPPAEASGAGGSGVGGDSGGSGPGVGSGGGKGGGGSGGGGGGNDPRPTSAEGGAALHIVAGSEQALQRAKGLAAVHLERIKEEYLRWSQLHRERGIQRSQSETGGEWGRRTPGRGSGGGRGGTGSRGSTLGDYILETPPARHRTK